MSKNIVFEGWLTKSPPTKRTWRAKWRRRWFVLRQSGELPGQYLIDYYTDRNCRRQKGSINLDMCEQVDAGLRMERPSNSLDNKVPHSVFTIRTHIRTYHLEAENEEDMSLWVGAICKVCGLRADSDNMDVVDPSQSPPAGAEHNGGPGDIYIPISECTTGMRMQNLQRGTQTAFTFDPKDIVTSSRSTTTGSQTTESRLANPDPGWDNDSSEDSTSHASQSPIVSWAVAKTFLKLNVQPRNDGNGNGSGDKKDATPAATGAAAAPRQGPPVPPRPAKTFQGPKMQEPVESTSDNAQTALRLHVPRRMSHGNMPTSPGAHSPTAPGRPLGIHPPTPAVRSLRAHSPNPVVLPLGAHSPTAPVRSLRAHSPTPPCHPLDGQGPSSPGRSLRGHSPTPPGRPTGAQRPRSLGRPPAYAPPQLPPQARYANEEDEPSTHSYCNVASLPPAVDRARKPRHSLHCQPSLTLSSLGHIYVEVPDTGAIRRPPRIYDGRENIGLQYLDLDLPASKVVPKDASGNIVHKKSQSAVDSKSVYKTVDFVQTEAFNITRQDAEASRSIEAQY